MVGLNLVSWRTQLRRNKQAYHSKELISDLWLGAWTKRTLIKYKNFFKLDDTNCKPIKRGADSNETVSPSVK